MVVGRAEYWRPPPAKAMKKPDAGPGFLWCFHLNPINRRNQVARTGL